MLKLKAAAVTFLVMSTFVFASMLLSYAFGEILCPDPKYRLQVVYMFFSNGVLTTLIIREFEELFKDK